MAVIKKGEDTYNLIVSRELEAKIRYMCSISPDNEWSGVLFYKVEGALNKENPLVATAIDFCLCDVGSSAYTEFETKPEVVTYMCDNDLLDCYMGLIHSHDKMSTFFSGTDVNTLEQEGKDMPHFLSLIVNNDGKYTAAITKKVERTFTGMAYDVSPSFGGEVTTSEPVEHTTVASCIFYYPMDIYVEGAESYPELKKRFDEIKEAKKRSESKADKLTSIWGPKTSSTIGANSKEFSNPTYSNSFRDYYGNSNYMNPSPEWYKQGEIFEKDIDEEALTEKDFLLKDNEVIRILKEVFTFVAGKSKSLETLIKEANERYLANKDVAEGFLDSSIDIAITNASAGANYDDDLYLQYMSFIASRCREYLKKKFDIKKYPVLRPVDDFLKYYTLDG